MVSLFGKLKDFLSFKDYSEYPLIYSVSRDTTYADGYNKQTSVVPIELSNDEIIYWYKNDPQVFGSVNRIADFVSGTGYDFKGKDSREAEEFFEKIPLSNLLNIGTVNALLWGNVFIELRDDYPFVVDSNTMEIVSDKHGRVKYYKQVLNNGNRIKIPADKMVHFKFGGVGFGLVGISPIQPLVTYLRAKSDLETVTSKDFKNRGIPRYHYKILTKDKEKRKRMSETIKSLKPYDDVISGDDLEIIPINEPVSDTKFVKWLEYLNSTIRVGFGVPDIIAGFSKDSNKANSRIQYQAFKFRIKAIQGMWANVINTKLIPFYLKGKDAYIVFKDFDKEDALITAQNRNKVAQALSHYVKNGILSPDEAKEYAVKDLEGLTKEVVE